MEFRDRIVGMRTVHAKDLVPDEDNWRRHGPKQRRALEYILDRIGIAGVPVVRRLEDGRLALIDGHLRRDLLDQDIKVLELDVNEREAKQLLATFDSVGKMAETDADAFERTMSLFPDEDGPAVMEIKDSLRDAVGVADAAQFDATKLDGSARCGAVRETYVLYISFASLEALQRSILVLTGKERRLPEGSRLASIDGEAWLGQWTPVSAPAGSAD